MVDRYFINLAVSLQAMFAETTKALVTFFTCDKSTIYVNLTTNLVRSVQI